MGNVAAGMAEAILSPREVPSLPFPSHPRSPSVLPGRVVCAWKLAGRGIISCGTQVLYRSINNNVNP